MRQAHAMPLPGLDPRGGHHHHPGWKAMARHGRGRGAPGPFGAGPFESVPFGPPFGGGGHRSWGRGGRGRARRGDVRLASLALLAEEPRNGYSLMLEIERRSEGFWRPSPGSIYPALQQLEDEGLIRADDSAGRRAYALTDDGRAYAEAHTDELAAVWDAARGDADDTRLELRGLLMQLGAAVHQVALAGGDAQVAEARRLLADTRRALYRLLAEDEPAGGDAPADGEDPQTA